MKILYDHQIFSFQKHGGISRYFIELKKRLSKNYTSKISVIFTENAYFSETININVLFWLFPNFRIRVNIYKFFNTLFSFYNIFRGEFDVFHPTYYESYYLKIIKKPFVITVHDLIPELFQDNFFKENKQLLFNRKKVIEKSTRIIAISENTKIDLIKFYKVSPEKIDVIYHGPNTFSKDKIINNWGRYILYVGSRDGYKNFQFFIESVSSMLKKNFNLRVICVGSSFTNKEIEMLSILGVSERVLVIEADNIILFQLYSNAICLVYPSLYEGFGMPILEAFDCGCPVVSSNSSSLPEIAQDGAIYFDPLDSLSMISCIDKVMNDLEFRSNLIINGYNRLNFFSWTKCAIETQITYRKCITT